MPLPLPERIETARLILQRLKYEDAEEIFYSYASKPEATRYMAWPTHQSIRDTHQFLRHARAAWNRGSEYGYSLRLKNSYRLIGSIGAINNEGDVQFGYVLSPTQWGNGLATEACQKLLGLLKSIPTIHQIGTFVDCDNKASIEVLRKSGLQVVEKQEKWFRFVNQNNEPKDCFIFRLP